MASDSNQSSYGTLVDQQQLSTPFKESRSLEPIEVACLVGTDQENDYDVIKFLLAIGLKVCRRNNGSEFYDQTKVLYVVESFEDDIFKSIQSNSDRYRCMSVHALQLCAQGDAKILPTLKEKRPIYCFFMANMSFAVEPDTPEVNRTVDLIHYMGGIAKKNYQHGFQLIANAARGENYKVSMRAVSLGSKVYTTEWIEACWAERDNPDFVVDENFAKNFLLKCFGGLSIYLYGFSDKETAKFDIQIKDNGGHRAINIEDASHIVISQDASITMEELLQKGASIKAHLVTPQWFSKSLLPEFCNNKDLYYPFPEKDNASRGFSHIRKLLISPIDGLGVFNSHPRKSFSRSKLDNSSISSDLNPSDESQDFVAPLNHHNLARYQLCMEMLETEKNYINHLDVMVKLFKDPLKNSDENNRILSKLQIRTIFGKIQPILNVHMNILKSLETLMNRWDEDYKNATVGYVWAMHSPDLAKVYPPFVNGYDNAVNMLCNCMNSTPKFLTFIKQAEADPECRKITLKDMLIKPLQRLPSLILLLQQIQKETEKTHFDYKPWSELYMNLIGFFDESFFSVLLFIVFFNE